MKTISIIWNTCIDQLPESHVISHLASGRPLTAYITFEWDFGNAMSDEDICDAIYHMTNLYSGNMWNAIADRLPEPRPHTALSMGDLVVIDGQIYRCAEFGWDKNDSTANFRRANGLPV